MSVPYQYVKKKAETMYTKSTRDLSQIQSDNHPSRNYKPYISTIPEHMASTHQFVASGAARFID
jgi:hypothetical protein